MFEVSNSGNETVITVQVGSFEAANVESFKEFIEAECPAGVQQVAVDLAAVDMIDSSAIGALLSVQKRLSDPTERVTIRGAKPPVLSVIELLRLHRVFRIESTVAAA